jgi:hypothetical protein
VSSPPTSPPSTLVDDPDPPRPGTDAARPTRPRALRAVLVVAVAVSVVIRFLPRSALWLDEAQAVAIARAPIGRIPALLRQDGAPPLYYVLLHVWMALFGDSDAAVRSLSLVASLAAAAVLAIAARRLAGRTAALCTVVLVLANPFAIRYATEGRMYALVTLEVGVGLIVVPAVLQRGHEPLRAQRGLLAGVALTTAALLYTHYWALYLLTTVVLVLLACALAAPALRVAVRRTLAAIAVGAALWLPWLPSFVFQARHTGTPWARPADLKSLNDMLPTLRGFSEPDALVLSVTLIVLALGALAVARTRRRSLPLAAVLVCCPLLALVGCRISHSAFTSRYTSVIFPFFVVLAAIGAAQLPRRARIAVLLLAAVIAVPIELDEAGTERTPGAQIADALEASASPGDVVLFCPDQLGPSTTRELDPALARTLTMGVYPDWRAPARVDWVDYAERYRAGQPMTFALDAASRAGTHDIWLVYSDLYPPTEPACANLRVALTALRPSPLWLLPDLPAKHLDHGALLRFTMPLASWTGTEMAGYVAPTTPAAVTP